eukprot:TRINITY_DN150_c0_g1_i10.p2 TRINITY_DN150_c0_g1~~TRINITY_DN150_c0_g1_i10.p2  ORF type:complete len:169 (-),score=7.00 TRINITY_DN150_c0_g1_i10:789-1295(-)
MLKIPFTFDNIKLLLEYCKLKVLSIVTQCACGCECAMRIMRALEALKILQCGANAAKCGQSKITFKFSTQNFKQIYLNLKYGDFPDTIQQYFNNINNFKDKTFKKFVKIEFSYREAFLKHFRSIANFEMRMQNLKHKALGNYGVEFVALVQSTMNQFRQVERKVFSML